MGSGGINDYFRPGEHGTEVESVEFLDGRSLREASSVLLQSQLWRARYLPELPLFTPLWDIMLDVQVHALADVPVPVSRVANDLGLTLGSVRRWVAVLDQAGLVSLVGSTDEPAISLNARASTAIERYITDLANSTLRL